MSSKPKCSEFSAQAYGCLKVEAASIGGLDLRLRLAAPVPALTSEANIKLNSRFNLPVCGGHLCLQAPQIFCLPFALHGDPVISFN
jgi:hypothetical protein